MIMAGKINPRNAHTQATGPVFDENSPAKFPNKGKSSGKTRAAPVQQTTGPTFTENCTLIPTMGAEKAPKASKQIAESTGKLHIDDHKTVEDRTASQSGSGEPTTPPYGLKESYEKSGQHGKRPSSMKW